MKKSIFTWSAVILSLMLLTSSCQKESITQTEAGPQALVTARTDAKSNVFKGPDVAIGNGYARSWIRISHAGQPEELGVELTEAAFNSLPEHEEQLLLPLHKKAKEVTPFNHIGFNYMNHGHFPPGVFDVPHFDAHFYMQTVAESLAIPTPDPSTIALFMLPPPAGYLPATYSAAGPEEQMGLHWMPPPPTFLPFTRVMIYGSFNGAFTFIEPMVTVAHLQGAGSSDPYLQPERFARAGNYPTVFNVYKDAETGNYNITLTNFVARTAN